MLPRALGGESDDEVDEEPAPSEAAAAGPLPEALEMVSTPRVS